MFACSTRQRRIAGGKINQHIKVRALEAEWMAFLHEQKAALGKFRAALSAGAVLAYFLENNQVRRFRELLGKARLFLLRHIARRVMRAIKSFPFRVAVGCDLEFLDAFWPTTSVRGLDRFQSALVDPIAEMANGLAKLFRAELDVLLKDLVISIAFAPGFHVHRFEHAHLRKHLQRPNTTSLLQCRFCSSKDALLELIGRLVGHFYDEGI